MERELQQIYNCKNKNKEK